MTKVRPFTLGDRVRELRLAHGWDQCYLACRCGVSRATIQRIEGNEYDPRLSTARALVKALGVDLTTLAGD